MVMEVVLEDIGDGSMQCTNHPYKNSTPGGICAFCLQEKLGKLVSSSLPVAIFPSASLSSSPSVRSELDSNTATISTTAISSALALQSSVTSSRRSKLPFPLAEKKKKKKKDGMMMMSVSDSASIVFKRSKSTTTPRHGMHFLDHADQEDYSPHKRGFWRSFLYSSSSFKHATAKKNQRNLKHVGFGSSSSSSAAAKREEELIVVEEDDDHGYDHQAAFDRKVSRSRSVGCGSRSFSGDFFERISTGLGDCTTLRRVESQREGKHKHGVHRNGGGSNNGQDSIKERVKCGGLFGGFMITSSSYSVSSSSSYWLSSSTEDHVNGKHACHTPSSKHQCHMRAWGSRLTVGHLVHGRSKSWGWTLASPMRAFGSKPSTTGKREAQNKNAAPNLAAIPSLLAVRT